MSNQAFIQVPPDGAGKKVYTLQHTVNGHQVHGYVNHIADPLNPRRYLAIDANGSASIRFAEGPPILSGFGNLKITPQRAIGIYESSLNNYNELFSTNTFNGATSVYHSQTASIISTVTGAAGSRVVRTTNRYHYYLPGTSNFIIMATACGDSGKAGNIRRWGLFDDNDGIYFELEGTTLNAVIRSSVTGTIVETKIPQTLWNADKLDGTGKSGIIVDLTKVNVWWIDYQWLGVGRVRFGIFEPNGNRLVTHVFESAGKIVLPYMRTGTLPLRIENVNVATTGSSSEIREICMAVYVDGTYEDYTFWRSASNQESREVTQSDQYIMAFRTMQTVNGKHNSSVVFPETIEFYTNQPVELVIWKNVTISGSTTWAQIPSSFLETTASGTPNFAEARRLKSIFFDSGASTVDLSKYFEVNGEGIQRNADGSANVWALTATPLTGNPANIKLSINFKELR